MSLQKSVPKNKAIYFNNLHSHTTDSIPVSTTIFLPTNIIFYQDKINFPFYLLA